MPTVGIWIAVLISLLSSAYYIGRTDCTNSYNEKALDSVGNVLEQQAQIEKENLTALENLSKQNVQQIRVSEAIKREREQNKNNAAIHLTRGDVRLLNASRSNQRPNAIRPQLTTSERGRASTVTEQTLISADIKCAEKHNECKTKRNALIDIVKRFQEKSSKIICQ